MTFDQCYRALRWTAFALATANLASVLLLDLREWIVYFDPRLVWYAIIPLFVIGLPSLPFLIRRGSEQPAPLAAKLAVGGTGIIFVFYESLWWIMIAIASMFRGPNWNFYWPWEERVPKLVPSNNLDLSEWYWIVWQKVELPSDPWLRELPGLILVTVHLVVIPLAVAGVVAFVSRKLPSWRVWMFMTIFQLLTLVPLKIAARHLVNLKNIVAFDT